MPREGQTKEDFLLLAFLLFMKKQLQRRTMSSSSCLLCCSELFSREERLYQVQPNISSAIQQKEFHVPGLPTGYSIRLWKQSPCCPASLSAPHTLRAKVGTKKPSQHPTFAPNICCGVSEDFEVSCLFIFFQSWDVVWSVLSLEMEKKCSVVFNSLCEWQWLMPFGRAPQGPWDECSWVCLGIG